MSKLTKAALASAIAAAVGLPGVSVAQSRGETGWYAGASLGQSTVQDCDVSGFPGASCDDKDTAWKLFGGFQINRTFSVELGYANLGEGTASGGGVNASIESNAWELVGVGMFPIASQFSLYGKLGLFRADSDLSGNLGSGSDSSSGLTFGVGGQYDFSRNMGVRAEWQRYADVGGDNTGGESDIDVMSIGVVFKF